MLVLNAEPAVCLNCRCFCLNANFGAPGGHLALRQLSPADIYQLFSDSETRQLCLAQPFAGHGSQAQPVLKPSNKSAMPRTLRRLYPNIQVDLSQEPGIPACTLQRFSILGMGPCQQAAVGVRFAGLMTAQPIPEQLPNLVLMGAPSPPWCYTVHQPFFMLPAGLRRRGHVQNWWQVALCD